ncbi:MAG: hypothetical protein ACT4QD_09235, partial [Acidobacteriota bacterium]
GPIAAAPPARAKGVYLVGPESYGVFKIVAELQKANVPTFRAATTFESGGRSFVPGTFVIPAVPAAQKILESSAKTLGIPAYAADRAPAVDGFRLKSGTRVGLYRGANNMPGGWLLWLLEQYGINHQVVTAQDFQNLAAKYDVILLPSGTSRQRIVSGLDQTRNDPAEWAWAAGVGEDGWKKLREFVENGGTLLAIGSAVETARDLLDLPIERSLPEAAPRFGPGAAPGGADPQVPATTVDRALREAFSSPAQLMQVLRDRVAEPANLFYCPGSLLQNEFDLTHPVAWGMPATWPVFFESDQAYRLRPGFGMTVAVAARYPRQNILQSGWLLGEEYLKDQANIVSFRVGRGYVVTYGSQVDFRTQPRATFKVLFNGMFHGPSTEVTAAQMERLSAGTTNNEQRH